MDFFDSYLVQEPPDDPSNEPDFADAMWNSHIQILINIKAFVEKSCHKLIY